MNDDANNDFILEIYDTLKYALVNRSWADVEEVVEMISENLGDEMIQLSDDEEY